MTIKEEFTISEASFITGQPIKSINRLFDEGPIRRRSTKRRPPARVLRSHDLFFVVAMSHEPLSHLDPTGKNRVYQQIVKHWSAARGRRPERVELGSTVELRWSKLSGLVRERAEELRRARGSVSEDPEVRGGEAVIRGSRVPVQVIHDLVMQGTSEEEILKHYPSLNREQVRLADVYARAYPKKGRPRRRTWHGRSL